jgi:hypothetical protein
VRLGLSWRSAGATTVVLFPFLIVAAQQGIPNGTWWDEAVDPPVWFTVLVALGAIVYGIDGIRREARDEREQIIGDLERLARRAFVPINAKLPSVPIGDLGVHIWQVRGGRLDRLVKYTMEHQRMSTPITWTRGKGVIGVAWQRKTSLTAELNDLYEEAKGTDDATFDAGDPDHRYGLIRSEVLSGTHYKGVLAVPLSGVGGDVIGVLSVDCSVVGQRQALEQLLDDRAFQDVLGACEITLRRCVEL